jgi:transposase
MNRYALRDDQWERIKDLLPGKLGDVGVTAHDNRRFVEAVLYRYRTGIPWRDLPERFGDVGPRKVCGSASSSTWPPTPTTNMR